MLFNHSRKVRILFLTVLTVLCTIILCRQINIDQKTIRGPLHVDMIYVLKLPTVV